MESSPTTPVPAGKNALEWLIFSICLVLVLGTLGVLTYEALHWQDRPAKLVTTVGEPYDEGDLTWVPVEVKNEGDRPAEQVTVSVEEFDRKSGKADFTLEEVPRKAVRKGRVSFPKEEGKRQFRAAVTGFSEE